MNNHWSEFAGVIAENTTAPCVILDSALRVKKANHAFYALFRLSPQQAENRPLNEIDGGTLDIPGLQALIERTLLNGRRSERVQVSHTFEHLGQKMLHFHRYTPQPPEEPAVIFLTVEDVTPYHYVEDTLQEVYRELEQQAAATSASLLKANQELHTRLMEYRRIEEALRASEARFAGILDIAIDAIVAADQSQNIVFFNQGAEFTFGYHAHEVIGKPLSLLMPERFRQSHQHHVQRFTAAGPTAQHMHERSPIWGLRKDGTEFPAEASISKLDQDGRWTFTVILRDITERRQMEENLQRALAEARELSELRSRFISMVSHELRTPLAIILSSSQVLENYGHQMSREKKLEYHDNIKFQVKHLTELLEDTLAISRAETVGLDFNPQPGNLEAFCRELVERMQLTVERTHRLVLEGGCGPQVAFDDHLMWLILNNLLSNAIKYSPDGGMVRLSLACNHEQIIIQVSDEGIGIPREDHGRLFESFHRGGNVGLIPGTGLGLAIVRQAVKAHGGTIAFESDEGVGTTFTLTIPVVS